MKDMNRIIIVGNGLDLAHGLKTKYEDFINWYWGRWLKVLCGSTELQEKDKLFEIRTKHNPDCLCNYYYTGSTERNIYKHIEKIRKEKGLCSIISPLLNRISEAIETKGWVDIETEYYTMLVECKGKNDELNRLNKDFAIIQGLLVEYLNGIQKAEIKEELLYDDIKCLMLAPLRKKDIAVSSELYWIFFAHDRADVDGINKMPYILYDYGKHGMGIEELKHLLKKNQTKLLLGDVEDNEADVFLLPDRIVLLNFNYTKTADLYMPDNPRFMINHIHGDLSSPETVIFGYGDESDDEYKRLQKINDNEYLRHIKTNRYLETPNYRDLLSFIDSAPFQVCIMGHSCGLSDKTLLNTLFEHKNCVSIKPYYYVNEQGKDNYLDMVQNISRNFTNPQLMRDRVVNKTFCEPLPQFGSK